MIPGSAIAESPLGAEPSTSGGGGGGGGPISGSFALAWDLRGEIGGSFAIAWDILSINPLSGSFSLAWDLRGSTSSTILAPSSFPAGLTLVQGAENPRLISFSSLDIQGDESSLQWDFQAEIPDRAHYDSIMHGDLLSIELLGTTFRFLIDGRSQSVDPGNETFQISGRTPLHGLDLAENLAEIAKGDSAKAMATAQIPAGMTLSWDTVDWAPPIEAAGQTTPIDFIRSLATAVRAVATLSPDGATLTVRPEWPLTGSVFALGPGGAFSLKDSLEVRDDFNRIDIVDSAATTQTQVQSDSERVEGTTQMRLRLRTLPEFPGIDLQDSGGGHFSASYQGFRTETAKDEIEIVDGKGSLSRYPSSITGLDWRYASQGTLTFEPGGAVTASGGGNSLVEVTYAYRSHVWLCEADKPRIQVYVPRGTSSSDSNAKITVARAPGDKPAPAISDPLLAGVSAMRERGRGEIEAARSRRNISLECPLVGSLPALGQPISMGQTRWEGSWTGKIVSIAIRLEAGAMPTLTVGAERNA